MDTTQSTVQQFLQYVSQQDLKNLLPLFSDAVDWHVPGDEGNVSWLGRRNNRQGISEFYETLWKNTEPVSVNLDNIFIDGEKAVIAGDFSIKMLQTNEVVDSVFFIQMTIKDGEIVKYRFLEDSHALSVALKLKQPVMPS